tara:strand:+ start:38 stop:640 length:603 start_codon:yes stop_codon:yes gene_type:complete
MALSTIKPASIDLSATFAFTGTVTGAGTLVLLNTTTISSATAQVNFDNSLITSTYKLYKIIISQATFATDGTTALMGFSTDNGSNFPAGHSHVYCNFYDDTFRMTRATSQSLMTIATSVDGDDSTADGSFSAEINIFDPANTSVNKSATWTTMAHDQSGVAVNFRNGNGTLDSTSAVNYIRLTPGSGNWTLGTFKLYGVL